MPSKTVPLLLAAAFATAALTVQAVAETTNGFLVVVNADNPTRSMTRDQVVRIFLGKLARWPESGEQARPLDLVASSPVREAFSRVVFGKEIAAVRSYWQRQVLTGRNAPPPELFSDREVLDRVRRDPGAVGYISELAVPGGVAVLSVIDDGEVIAGPAGGSSGGTGAVLTGHQPRGPAGDQVVDQRGDVQLILTGSCGPRGRGENAVLVSDVPFESVRVTVETSMWVDGRLKSKTQHSHTLPPRGEKSLGCTWLSENSDKRFAIARVSDVVAHHEPPRPPGYDKPARTMAAIVSGATCGRDHQGRTQLVVNRHASREISVKVEVLDRIADRQTRRTTRSLRLAPGSEKRLGCSAEGQLVRQFRVLKAAYR